jgi:uncharacterized protein (DUF1800 family)
MKNLFIYILFLFANTVCYGQNIDQNKVLNRIGYGVTTNTLEILKQKSPQIWINEQLKNPYLYDDQKIIDKNKLLTINNQSLLSLYQTYDTYLNNDNTPDPHSGILYENFKQRMNYAIYSENRIREMMVWFWFNHFNVNALSNQISLIFLNDYESNIRTLALGNFKDILKMTMTNPAMLHYLNNDQNRSPDYKEQPFKLLREDVFLNEPENFGYNENYARELLELHTMGVGSGYSQKDIEQLSHFLSGYTYLNFLEANKKIPLNTLKNINFNTLKTYFPNVTDNFFILDQQLHNHDSIKILNHTINDNLDELLDLLVSSPATAHHISKKMATFFLGQNINEKLVQKMANTFIKTKGNIADTLYVLFNSPIFWDSVNKQDKYKDIYNRYVSLYKTTLNGKNTTDFMPLYQHLQNIELPVYGKITPEGYSLNSETYLSSQLLNDYMGFTKFYLLYSPQSKLIDLKTINLPSSQNDLFLYFISRQGLTQ